jgi:hypothetical protein
VRHDRLRQEKHRENVCAKSSFQLAFRNLGDAFTGMLFRRVVHQNIDFAQLAFRPLHRFAAELLSANIARDQQAPPPLRFDQAAGFARVFVLVQINNCHIGTFLCVEHGDRTPDPAIAAGDQRDAISQLPGTDVLARAGFRLWTHGGLTAGLLFLVLRWTCFFLFRHGEKRIAAEPGGRRIRFGPAGSEKSQIFEKKCVFRIDGWIGTATLLARLKRDSQVERRKELVLAYFGTANWNSILSRLGNGNVFESDGRIGFFYAPEYA